MYVISFILILLSAVPGITGAVRVAKDPPETRSIAAVIGILLLAFLATALLLGALYLDLLF